jgi:ribosomal-protein-alanine N-acetyltransferase
MLIGKTITLRPIRETDLEKLYNFHTDIRNRGDYFPRGIMSHATFRKRFHESGFWGNEDGMLLIVNSADEILGHIEFFKTVNYLDEIELSYQVYATQHYSKGIMTEAVNMLVRYLFETRRINRIRLIIHPGNAVSRRLADKCGFQHEGTARRAWYNKGRYHDVEIYSILHHDVITGD